MRKIALYYSIAFGLLAAGCAKEIEIPEVSQGESDTIELNLRILDSKTRVGKDGVKDGVSEYNENALGGYLDVFFYANNADLDTPAIESVRASINPNTARVSIPTSAPAIRTIFGGTTAGRTCKVFVVANYNGTTPMSDIHSRAKNYSRRELNKLVLAQATWSDICDAVDGSFSPGDTPNFVMTGEATLESRGVDAAPVVSGEIYVSRIASKVTFSINVKDTINVYIYSVDNRGNRIKIIDPVTEEWNGEYERKKVTMKPSKDAMVVNLCYANNYAELSGESYVTEETDDPHLFDYKYRPLVQSDGTYKAQPFYSYPQDWGTGAANQPYLKLKIPWTPIDENNNAGSTKEYYYKIPLPEGELKRNNWYQIGLDVSILGGEEQEPIPVPIKYCVAPWVADSESEASVVSSRYLSVARTEYILYNNDALTIPIASSHDVEIVGFTVRNAAYSAADKANVDNYLGNDPRVYNTFTATLLTTAGNVNATKPNFNNNTMGTPVPTTVDASSWFPSVQLSRDQIGFYHELNNDLKSKDSQGYANYDIAPITIRFRVRHKDKPDEYYKDIIIEQRPAIYIEPNQNSDNGNQYYPGSHKGYVYIDGGQSTRYEWKYVRGLDGNNKNVNMYVIHASVLDASSNYVLGDPRSESIDNLNFSFAQAPALYGSSSRRLTYYYPTQETDGYKNVLAPTIRVASSYGVCNGAISKAYAKQRCAAYQEDGYPAGRWRVPTRAEVEFITTLSSQGVIPTLFNVGSQYWCATGAVTPTSSGVLNDSNNNTAFVRCVYDEWYWSNTGGTNQIESSYTTFTWGDQPR